AEEGPMGKINLSRVILGGAVAGIVVNILSYLLHDVVLKTQHEEMMKALGKTLPAGGDGMVMWLVYGFVWALVAVWLYAAIRPRLGAGPGTAVKTGVVVWFFGSFLTAFLMVNLGLMGWSPLQLVLELVVSVLAVLAGAAVYKEAV
ncbi:MAG: hypothetical protein ABI968_01490, partial [Acidobacteriota bacterium]